MSGIVEAIRDNPTDSLPRLVYADWLEERGGEDNEWRAAVIRLTVANPEVILTYHQGMLSLMHCPLWFWMTNGLLFLRETLGTVLISNKQYLFSPYDHKFRWIVGRRGANGENFIPAILRPHMIAAADGWDGVWDGDAVAFPYSRNAIMALSDACIGYFDDLR